MEEDFDNEVGFWIKNIPYLWARGDTILTSKRFYLLKDHGLELFDENDNLTDISSRQNIKSIDKKRISTSKETFSLVSIEGKNCSFIRNYFLVWTFSNGERDGKPILYKKYKDKQGNHKNKFNSWVDTADIRIEGVRYKKLEPEFPRKFNGNTMTILDCKECMKHNNTRIIFLQGYEYEYIEPNENDEYSELQEIRECYEGKNNYSKKKCIVSRSMESQIQPNIYYQDRKKKWGFNLPTQTSYNLLCRMSNFVERLFNLNTEIIKRDFSDRDIDLFKKEGESIYDEKPFKNESGITWSQNEYDHPGFHRAYIKYKSVQRFTETWELLRRAHNLGFLFNVYKNPKPRTIRVASLAGGPGFELYALKEFFSRYYPHLKVECISLDLAESWRPYAEELGLEFDEWNVDDGKGLPKKLKSKIDFAIVSYALHMYMSKHIHFNWLSKAILNDTIPMLFVNSRMKSLKDHIVEMKKKGVDETDLLERNKKGHRDNRQIVYYKPDLKIKIPKNKLSIMFPNVPYE